MAASNSKLGRLERIDLRSVWSSESDQFTPWLAEPENLQLLGSAIGTELQFEALEKDVGPFRADILCKDVITDNWVLIENQLERTNHTHLGQVITYAAGLDAVTIVWIAAKFTDEHRAALDWLNEKTGRDINFFALEVELWKIGDSLAAPKFNVVSSPNEWTREIASGAAAVERGELSDNQKLQLSFWTGFFDFILNEDTPIRPSAPKGQNVMPINPGETGYGLGAVANLLNTVEGTRASQELRAEFWITGSDPVALFDALESNKPEIERGLTEELHWHGPANSNSRRVFIQKTVDFYDKDQWPSYYRWLLKKLELLRSILGPRARELRTHF